MNKEKKLKVISWYVNTERILQFSGSKGLSDDKLSRLKLVANTPLQKGLIVSIMSELTIDIIKSQSIKPLEQILLQNTLQTGNVFTFDGRFYSKGLSCRDQKSGGNQVLLRCKLHDFGIEKELHVKFSQNGLTTDSAWGALSGQPSVFVTAYVDEISDTTISCRPLVIGNLVESTSDSFESNFGGSLEIRPENFDALSKVNFTKRHSIKDLEILKSISEDKVKHDFAEILGEAVIQKDWGGEQCDLYSSQILIESQRTICAFAFKGPAKFKPMEPADCGKNGDQIVRLFDTGADVLILQHCHTIKPAVRKTMEAFARADFNKLRRYCIFDGFDTLTTLKHFNRLNNGTK